MITELLSLDGTAILTYRDIVLRGEHQYCYGISFTVTIGVTSHADVEEGGEYKINFNDRETATMMLYRIYSKKIANETIEVYEFVDKLNYDILNNLLPTSREIFSIKLTEYVKEMDNQLSHIIFNLRKKSLFLKNENNKPKHIHIQEATSSKTIDIEVQNFKIKKIEGDLKRLNYYTVLEDNAIARTTKGKSLPQYVPFATKEDINGLDNYYTPKYELSTSFTKKVDIGDVISLEDSLFVVMEIDIFAYKEDVLTTIIVGDKKA